MFSRKYTQDKATTVRNYLLQINTFLKIQKITRKQKSYFKVIQFYVCNLAGDITQLSFQSNLKEQKLQDHKVIKTICL